MLLQVVITFLHVICRFNEISRVYPALQRRHLILVAQILLFGWSACRRLQMTLRLLKLPLRFVSRFIVSAAHVGENGIRPIRVGGVLLPKVRQLIDSLRSQFTFPLGAIPLLLLRVENDRVQVLVNVN